SRTLALVAALNGKLNVIKVLYDNGANLDIPDEDGDTPLFCAAQNGFSEIIRFLVSKNCDVNHRNKTGRTPISAAIGSRNFEIARYFYDHGARLTVVDMEKISLLLLADFLLKDENGNSSLYYFLDGSESLDHSAISELLLDVDEQNLIDLNSQGFGLCHMAAKKDSVKLLRELRDRGWDLSKTTASGETCITLAAKTSGSKALKFLLELSRNKDAMEPELSKSKQEQEKAFRICAELGKIELTDELFSRGVNVNATDEEGNTALMIACQHKQNDFALSLLSRESIPRVDVDVKNQNGFSALHFASKNQLTDCVEKLLSLGAKTDSEMLQFLIDKEIPANGRDEKGNTACMIASYQGHQKSVKLLLEHDRSLGKERNADGSTPALLAAMKGKHEVLQVLAENDCLEANDVDNDGSTILMMAIQSGSVPTVRMLLETGDCNTTAVNNNGIGVQTLATQCRDEAMLELLRQFGIEGQLAEAEATEAQQTPEEQESEEDTDQQQEELEGLDCGVGKPKRHKARFAVDRILKDTTTNDQLTDEE
uniref:ANK_REP_REGION domain-containing protein n=1 Tax=Macrostomum lignano TaxID=282301 RepID=A0A1I8GUN0_9PLAT